MHPNRPRTDLVYPVRGLMSESGMVGRSAELSILNNMIAGAASREVGGVTLVKGSAGIGKSRLIEELASDASSNGFLSVWAHCQSGSGVPILWPWVQVLRSLVLEPELEILRKTQSASLQRLASHFAEFGHWTSDVSERVAVDQATEKFLLFDAIRTVVKAVAQRAPILILIEDLQWADPESVSVLEMMLESPGPRGIELVVSVRDDALSGQRYVPPQSITGSAKFTSIALQELDQADAATLFQNLVGQSLDAESLEMVWNVTGGNPLFIREYASSWEPGSTAIESAVPSSAVETIESRLRMVPAESLEVIEYGAALGNEFDFARLAAAMHVEDKNSLIDTLGSSIEFGFISEKSDSVGWFRFTHEVIRTVVYDRLPNSRRAQIHREIAEALEQLPDESTVDHAAEISSHWQNAGVTGDMGQSAVWALRAGREALASYSYDAARGHFERAQQVAHQIGKPDVETEGFAGAGKALAPLGREDEAIELLKMAFDRFVESGASDRAIQVAQVSFTGARGQIAMAPIYERALGLVTSGSLDEASIQAPLARAVAVELGDYKRGRSLLGAAIRTARKQDDRGLESLAAGYGVQVAAFSAEWTECVAFCERVLELQTDVDDPYSVSTAGMLLAVMRVRDGRHQESDALINLARKSAERSGNRLRLVSCDLFELRIAHSRAQWDRVKDVISKTNLDETGTERVHAMMALCHYSVGDEEAGADSLQRFFAMIPDTKESPDAQYFPLLARSTGSDEHIAIVKDAAAIAERSRAEYVRRRGAIAKAWMAIEEGDVSTGKDAFEVLEFAELLHDEATVLPALRHLCGDIEGASIEFEQLIAEFHENGIFFYEAWARYDYSRLLAENPDVRPKLSAQKYASEARAYALGIGLTPLVGRLDELLESLGVTRTPFDLTRREIDVLTLVAQGSTNKEIAESLFVSPHTVNRHLGNLFNKLGVSSRAAATDLAHQRGIV
ncbi:AAA family ATPase [Candidatus Lucifugimonas marina]|uniref:AAA family ATPase n=2 Tax=Candidatus Lucifugimonas marina TaxID=3038979 RepID=A0AAJ5ZLK2_9CHLR|nr:AAA family ATPase [SAR202 cluster bacterium JH702]MDG0870939.1 AAA family ATPase [SAR202 cluster bacterium JH639]WFG36525.1 AAA family ATPase [SAR202 cluster bacterium JH545]WFG40458.1 AAA family ATPase [SAR202 cluster bacterium JH1073]